MEIHIYFHLRIIPINKSNRFLPFGGVRGSFQLLPRKLLRSIYFHAKGSKARTVMGVVDRGRGLMTSTRTYRFHIVCSQTAGGLLL